MVHKQFEKNINKVTNKKNIIFNSTQCEGTEEPKLLKNNDVSISWIPWSKVQLALEAPNGWSKL